MATDRPTTGRFCEREFPLDAERIDCVNVSVESLSPLGVFTNLRELHVLVTNPHEYLDQPFADLSPLADLTSLEVLELPNSEVADVSPLSGLHRLRILDLGSTRVGDVAPLQGL